MTAKEKAIELVEKIIKNGYVINRFNAKQCALIAVDEIINEFEYSCCECANVRYWQEVKTEIEKL